MKKLLTVFSIFILTACDGGNITTQSEQEKSTASKANDSASTYSLRGKDNSWPRMDGGQVDLSSNLLAKNYYLVVDGSGSMKEQSCSSNVPKLSVAKSALESFINKLPAAANIGMLVFDNNGTREILSISQNNQTMAVNAVRDLQAGGGTPLGKAITQGYKSLTEQAKSQLGYGEYHLVVVTDGFANKGDEPDQIVRDLLKGSPVTLHTIGFCIDQNHALNIPGFTLYKSAENPSALVAGLDAVLAEAPDFQVDNFKE